jgi:membrane protein
MRRWLKVLVNAGRKWMDDHAFQHSAAVSFYTLFSLAPITIIAVGVASFFVGPAVATRQFSLQMTQLVGAASTRMIQDTVVAAEAQHRSWLANTAGVILLLVGATSVFAQLQDSLNQLWGVRAAPRRNGFVVLLLQRLVSFGMVLTFGFLLLVSLVITTVLQSFVHSAQGGLTVPPSLLQAIDFLAGLAVITLLFGAFFKILPDVQLRWREVWGGAFLTSALFSAGRFLIGFYLGHSTVASVYGAGGSLVALLVWIYYSCAIMFYGVEYTRARREDEHRALHPARAGVLVRPQSLR